MSNYPPLHDPGIDGVADLEPEYAECKRCYGMGEDRDGADCLHCDGYGEVKLR